MKCSGSVALLPSGQHLGEWRSVRRHPHEARTSSCTRCFSTARPSCRSFRCTIGSSRRACSSRLRSRSFRPSRSAGAATCGCWWSRWTRTPAGRELLRYSFGIFDRQGHQLAAVRHFTVKKVRSLQNIRRLLEKSLTFRPLPAAAPARVAAPAHAAARASRRSDQRLDWRVARPQWEFVWNPNDADKPFFELGLDSLALLDAAEALEKRLGVRLYPTALFENPDVAALTAYLRATFPDACAAYARHAPKAIAAVTAEPSRLRRRASRRAVAAARQAQPLAIRC